MILQLFAANQNKPADIVSILVANKSKLLRLFADFKTDKGTKDKCVLTFFFPCKFLGLAIY